MYMCMCIYPYTLWSTEFFKRSTHILKQMLFCVHFRENITYFQIIMYFQTCRVYWWHVTALIHIILWCSSIVVTLVNWCGQWFEYFPNPPLNVLAMVENLLAHHDAELLECFVRHSITTQVGPSVYIHTNQILQLNIIIFIYPCRCMPGLSFRHCSQRCWHVMNGYGYGITSFLTILATSYW